MFNIRAKNDIKMITEISYHWYITDSLINESSNNFP
jgi:hypothetical protein